MPDILCYGDSNTFGTIPMQTLEDDGRFGRDTRWPCVMAAELGPDWHLIEAGLPGRTTVHDDPIDGPHKNGLRTLKAIIESHRPLDVMVLMLGTNDLKQRFGLTGQDVALGARRLVEEALATGHVARLLLVCPPATRVAGCLAEMFSGAEARAASVAAHMGDVAALCGVRFFDAGQLMECDPRDGVHFSADGHERLGRAIAGEVRSMMEEQA